MAPLTNITTISVSVARHYASPAVAVPPAINEPILSFPPGSQERKNVEKV